MLHTRLSDALVQICCSSFVWSSVALLRDGVMKSKHLETVSAFHRTFEVFEISCSQNEQNHSQRTRRITDKIRLYLRKTTTCSNTHHLWLWTLPKRWNLRHRTTGLWNAEYAIYCLLAPISCYNWCVENRLWKLCYLKFWVYSVLTLITMIIIVHNSPFCSLTVPCNF